MPSVSGPRRIWLAWSGLGLALAAFAVLLTASSGRFGPRVPLIDMPSLPLAAGLVMAGLIFLLTPALVRASLAGGLGADRRLLALVLAFGLLFRLVLLLSTPAFETDWNRYLWDGAVAANGYNPYAVTPDDAQGEEFAYSLRPLALASGTVIERVNHSHLKTAYPPVAEAVFALAHVIMPWSLTALRMVFLCGELAALALLLVLLREAGRSPLWVSLYWWNPVVIKETINSAHMEAIVTPLVLSALLLCVYRRHLASVAALGLAIGAKLWPVMLTPLVLWPLRERPKRLAAAIAVLSGLCILWVLPVWQGGIDETSGFVAFAQYWRPNSALFPVLDSAAKRLLSGLDLAATAPGLIVRLMLAGVVGLVALAVARRAIQGAQDLMLRAGLVTATLFLLSPAQFPWYAIWMLPYLCFHPSPGLLLANALVPIYYASFHFLARDTHEFFRTWVVWLIWIPVWSLLALEAWQYWRRSTTPGISGGGLHA